MKTIIAGSRHITDLDIVRSAIAESGFQISEVVCGCAVGVDTVGSWWAVIESVPITRFKPNWNTHGKAAGPIRNRQMAEYAEALIAVWDGKSRGTKNMIEEAEERGLKVFVKIT